MGESINGISRRGFMGTITGAAAMTLVGLDRKAFAGHGTGNNLLTDYEGRLCYNENPLGPSIQAIQAIRSEAQMSHRYPDWFADSLVAKLANLYGLSTDQVVCGAGATEILRLCAMAFAEPGGNIVAPYPSYSQFPGDAQFFGSSVRYSDLDGDYRVDLQDMMNHVDSDTTAVCITNPNNPTGTIVDAGELSSFVDDLPSEVVTIVDEAYYEYISDSNYPSAIEMIHQDKNVVLVKTFSKVYGLAGARIGYAVGKSSRISEVKSQGIFATVSRPSLEAAKASIGDSHVQSHVHDTVKLAGEAKTYCFREFNLMDLDYIPSETNFFMVDVGDAGDVCSQLAALGIYVRTGWGMPNHLRVSTGTTKEMEDFISALREILQPGMGIGKVEMPLMPAMTELYQAYPNPFNSSTNIRIGLPKEKHTKLEIFDIRGRLVKTIVNGVLGAGKHSFAWNGTNSGGRSVSSGSYFYRLTSGEDVITRRMILVR